MGFRFKSTQWVSGSKLRSGFHVHNYICIWFHIRSHIIDFRLEAIFFIQKLHIGFYVQSYALRFRLKATHWIYGSTHWI